MLKNQNHRFYIFLNNRTYALADVTVKISLVANDNIANAIWNDGDLDTMTLSKTLLIFKILFAIVIPNEISAIDSF